MKNTKVALVVHYRRQDSERVEMLIIETEKGTKADTFLDIQREIPNVVNVSLSEIHHIKNLASLGLSLRPPLSLKLTPEENTPATG